MVEKIIIPSIESSGFGKKFAEAFKTDGGFGKEFADNFRKDGGLPIFEDGVNKVNADYQNIDRRLPKTGGEWEGVKGDSKWKPDPERIPENEKTNPDRLSWGEILTKYSIDGIPFHDGEPDFSDVSKGTVEIVDYSDDRDDNFDAADEALAKERGCTKEEVRAWRKDNGYTWHERSDMKTMDKVPTEVHGNVPHEGGISAKKKENENG